jgi:hypothetical protein
MHVPIHVGRHVGVANNTEHPSCLVVTKCQFVGPVCDARPSRRVEELLRRDIQRVAVNMAFSSACIRPESAASGPVRSRFIVSLRARFGRRTIAALTGGLAP